MDEQARYHEAKVRMEKIRSFYFHLTTYLFVNALLVVINLINSPEHLWFIWPLSGWGVGLIIHAFQAYGGFGIWGKSWEEGKIRKIMEKDELSRSNKG